MTSRAIVFSLILLASVIPSIGNTIAKNSVPLQLTTLTSYETTTFSGLSTYTSYEQQTSSMTTDSNSFSFTVQAPSQQYGCNYEYVPFGTFSGDIVTFHFTSDSPINFYVMSNSTFQAWVKAITCSVGNFNYYVGSVDTSSYDYVWTSPAWADYDAVFVNTSHQNAATIQFYMLGRSQTCCVATSTFTSGVLQIQPFTMTSTTSTSYEEPIGTMFEYGWLLVLAIAVIAGLAIGAYYWQSKGRKRKSKQTKLDSMLTSKPTSTPPAQPRKAETQTPASTMFCSRCGARITRDSKFCKECGSEQH
jgi:zinc-ribbon domain